MRSFKGTAALLCAAAMVFCIAGCGQTDPSIRNSTESSSILPSSVLQTDVLAETKESRASLYPMTVTDSFGNDVTLDSEPLRVISVGPSITENLYAIGAGDKLVGRTDYCDFPAEVLSVESVGVIDAPDIEKIVSLEPDLVIASSIFTEESYNKLTELGIKVFILHNEYDVSGVYASLEMLGDMMNRQDQAAAVSAAMKTSIDETTAKISGLDAPSVYYVVGYGEYGDYTAGGDTFVGTLLTIAGGKNVAQDVSGWSYSLESLIEADPDIILLPIGLKDGFVTAENYKDLSAVKNGKVFEVDCNLLERQGYRNADGIRALAEIFYPDAFAEQ